MGEVGHATAVDVDVSAVGTLVWVRRPNGSWWPGRVVSPHEVPDSCPPPVRSPATPILLLGRRDGTVFVDWCNLERCKRVKPFRCGEADLEDCIRKAEEQQAARRGGRRDQRVCATASRYARKEDAVLQALDIERARLRPRLRSSSRPTTTTTTATTTTTTATTTTTKPSPVAAASAVVAPTDAQPSARTSTRRKRRTPNDSEDDAPQRMKDLTDIGAPPKHATPNAAETFTDLNRHLPSTSQMKRSKQSHHDSPKRKQQQRPSADQDQPCGLSRKRDRSRPLSELCNGDNMWKNGFTPNGQHLLRGASTLNTVPAKPRSRRAIGPVKTEPVDDQVLGMPSSRRAIGPVKTEPVDDAFPRPDDQPVYLAARSILKQDHFHAHQPCASTKAPTSECMKPASNCGKNGVSSQCDSRNSKRKTTSSADHRKERAAKHKAPSNEVVLLKRRVERKSAADKTAAPNDYKDLAVTPNGLNCAGTVLRKCKLEEPSETISNRLNFKNVPAPSVVFKLPHQVSWPQHRNPAVARCHAVKPVKTLQLNSSLYEVQISAQGASSSNSKGGRVPLVSLMSRSSQRPVVGYPVTVAVLDDSAPRPPARSTNDGHRPSTSKNTIRQPKNTIRQPKEEVVEEEAAAAPRRAPPPSSSSHRAARVTRTKAKSRRKSSEDESWRPHTKNSIPVASASPRKMRRLSSFGPVQRVGGEKRRPVVGEFSRGPALACVPLRLVFSRIHEALSQSGK